MLIHIFFLAVVQPIAAWLYINTKTFTNYGSSKKIELNKIYISDWLIDYILAIS